MIDTKAVLRTMELINTIEDNARRNQQMDAFMLQLFRGLCENVLSGSQLEDMDVFIQRYTELVAGRTYEQ